MTLFSKINSEYLEDLIDFDAWDRDDALDIVVYKIDGVHAPVHLGVKFCTTSDEEQCIKNLEALARRGEVPKTLLVVLNDPDMVREDSLLAGIISTFPFDRRNSDHGVVTVNFDASYRCFPLQRHRPTMRQEREEPVSKEVKPGVLTVFFRDRGYGFIDSGHQKFFVHISRLSTELQRQVNDPVDEPTPVNVLFRDGGPDSSGRPYSRALDVRVA